MLSWVKFENYPRNWSCPSEIYTALYTKNRNIAKRLPSGNKMADKKAKTSTCEDYSFTSSTNKEGIKFMEPVVSVGEKRMHHFTPQTKQN